MSFAGHYWTLTPRLRPLPPDPPSEPWSLTVEDPDLGPVRLSGRWSEAPAAGPDPAVPNTPRPREAVLLLHGIAGCADSRYCRLGAASALEMGMACLRLNLRGADRAGEDYYHAGLTSDLEAALGSPELAPYDRIYVVGYSLGGHLALRLGTVVDGDGPLAGRLAGVAGLCSPLDLEACQRAFDRPPTALYRLFVLRGLKQLYSAVAARRPVPLAPAKARRIRTLRQWDERVVAPRWGFDGAADYYARASVGPRLGRLSVPALLVAGEDDPMVPPSTLHPVLEGGDTGTLEVRWLAGAGHLGFPPGLRLGGATDGAAEPAGGAGESSAPEAGWSDAREAGLDVQVLRWLRQRGQESIEE